MIIDCHAHLVPPSLLDAIRTQASHFPSIRLIEDGGSLGFSFAGGKPTRPVSKPLSDLPARQREAIVLRYYADLSEADIAAAMRITRGAVKSHTARAMASLKAALEQDAQ